MITNGIVYEDIDTLCEYFNINQSLVYEDLEKAELLDKYKLMDVLDMTEDEINRKCDHIGALDDFIYKYQF
ncbi:hypothetical protein L3V86_00330 [Thiotrichales bacterium 19S11-10]|nr:hypothetical protein [Thiotrichales bacterium 19S11-10]